MQSLVKLGQRFVREEEGLAVTEYGLLLALVAVALIAVVKTFGTEIGSWFKTTTGKITSATP